MPKGEGGQLRQEVAYLRSRLAAEERRAEAAEEKAKGAMGALTYVLHSITVHLSAFEKKTGVRVMEPEKPAQATRKRWEKARHLAVRVAKSTGYAQHALTVLRKSGKLPPETYRMFSAVDSAAQLVENAKKAERLAEASRPSEATPSSEDPVN